MRVGKRKLSNLAERIILFRKNEFLKNVLR